MNRCKKYLLTFLLTLMCCVSAAVPALAAAKGKWILKNGAYIWVNRKGIERVSKYYPAKKKGIVTVGNNKYCYRWNGKKYAGLLKTEDGTFYFKPSKGKMVRNKRIKIKTKYYYFDAEGRRVTNTWIKNRYYGKKGAQLFKRFVGDRYVTKKGKMAKGPYKINKKLYYFDKETGIKLMNQSRKVNGDMYYFDENGVGKKTPKTSASVETSYYTDPQVDDETLLAAIIYCESGNQPYYGQLAVGLVIMNRVKSNMFPNKLREVIYAKQQFEPCRNSAMTRCLKGTIHVSDSCRKAAAEALKRSASGNYAIDGPDNKKVNMAGYYFFMTKAAYKRLGLKSRTLTLKDHVFFKNWQR